MTTPRTAAPSKRVRVAIIEACPNRRTVNRTAWNLCDTGDCCRFIDKCAEAVVNGEELEV